MPAALARGHHEDLKLGLGADVLLAEAVGARDTVVRQEASTAVVAAPHVAGPRVDLAAHDDARAPVDHDELASRPHRHLHARRKVRVALLRALRQRPRDADDLIRLEDFEARALAVAVHRGGRRGRVHHRLALRAPGALALGAVERPVALARVLARVLLRAEVLVARVAARGVREAARRLGVVARVLREDGDRGRDADGAAHAHIENNHQPSTQT